MRGDGVSLLVSALDAAHGRTNQLLSFGCFLGLSLLLGFVQGGESLLTLLLLLVSQGLGLFIVLGGSSHEALYGELGARLIVQMAWEDVGIDWLSPLALSNSPRRDLFDRFGIINRGLRSCRSAILHVQVANSAVEDLGARLSAAAFVVVHMLFDHVLVSGSLQVRVSHDFVRSLFNGMVNHGRLFLLA